MIPPPADYGLVSDTLRKHARLIIAVASVVSVGAAVYRVTRPPQYQAVVTLRVSQSKLGDMANPVAVATANVVPVLQSPAVVMETIAALGLSAAPRAMTPAVFLRDVLRVNPLGGTALVEIRVRFDSPDLAARTANVLAERAVVLARSLTQTEAIGARDQLRTQLDDSKRRYEAATSALEALKGSSHIDWLRKDAESILAEQRALLPLVLQVEAERAKLARAEQELAKRPRVDVVTRAIDGDPALLAAVLPAAGGRALELKLRDEQISQVHDALDGDVARMRATLAGLQEQLDRSRRAVGPAGQAKLARLYQSDREVAAAEVDVQIAQNAYVLAANQYESARLQVSSRAEQLQIVSPAIPPDRPLSRQVAMHAILAFALTAGFVAFVAVVMPHVRTGRAGDRSSE